jgi:hypothetical protein
VTRGYSLLPPPESPPPPESLELESLEDAASEVEEEPESDELSSLRSDTEESASALTPPPQIAR